ncbi:MAG: nitrilase-related carbon-nitrogen hydrolase [Armatimonadota bacterium]|nr:nitrilase-related carbon-nitrogen hydrolase [Armatimonadota bacterium]
MEATRGAPLRVAAWQGRCVDGNVEANLSAVHRAIAAAAEVGAAFLCLPETFLSGYGTRQIVEQGALSLDDPRLVELGSAAADRGLVLLVGLTERLRNGELGNTVAIYAEGQLLGIYRKTMLTGSDAHTMRFCRDYDLPVFHARGICFGCIICHDSSFVEPAQVLAYKGVQVLFSPHYNAIPMEGMDAHRLRVRNNHVGLAALLGVYVVRANVVGKDAVREGTLGYGDSAIFGPDGVPLAEAGLFRERLIWADIDPALATGTSASRRDPLPDRVRQQLAEAALNYQRRDPSVAPAGPDCGGIR